MKKLLKSYTSFSRTERLGLFCLCGLLIILISIRATMSLWVHPDLDTEKQQKMATAWETFKRSQPKVTNDSTVLVKNDYQDALDENETPLQDIIDLNTADSATLVRLKGIGPATASKIVAYRLANGPFTSVDQLLDIRHFPDATFDLLKKHFVINKTE